LVEEREGRLFAYEVKWKAAKVKSPELFLQAYPEAVFDMINSVNYQEFVL